MGFERLRAEVKKFSLILERFDGNAYVTPSHMAHVVHPQNPISGIRIEFPSIVYQSATQTWHRILRNASVLFTFLSLFHDVHASIMHLHVSLLSIRSLP